MCRVMHRCTITMHIPVLNSMLVFLWYTSILKAYQYAGINFFDITTGTNKIPLHTVYCPALP